MRASTSRITTTATRKNIVFTTTASSMENSKHGIKMATSGLTASTRRENRTENTGNGIPTVSCSYKKVTLTASWSATRKSGHSDGQLLFHGFYDDGKLEGEFKRWHVDGTLLVHGFSKDRELDGEYKEWFEDGQIKKICTYRAGKLDGESKEWFHTGRLYKHFYSKDGKLDGKYKEWFYDGRLLCNFEYEAGEQRRPQPQVERPKCVVS